MAETTLGAQLPLFMLAALLLNATPGADLLLTVARTAQGGARAGGIAALGIGAGCALHALAAAFGLAALLALSAGAFALITGAGAAYLLWLGLGLLRAAWRRGPPPAVPPGGSGGRSGHGAAPSAAAEFRRGLLTNLLNPKVALFMLAFVPQFIPAALPHKTLAFLALGALFALQGTLFLLLVVACTARLSRLPLLARAARAMRGLAGLLFIGLALRLAGMRVEGH